jgi:hypothetical protein
LDAASSGSGGNPFNPPPATVKTFEIENTSPVVFNYLLHKTGIGNKSTPCKITSSTFSHELFSTNPSAPSSTNDAGPNPTYDITCFLEAEELSLYHGGMNLKIKASPDTCEYVAYEPYRFYQYQPGSSSKTIELYRCDGVDDGELAGTPFPPKDGAVCNQAIDDDNDMSPSHEPRTVGDLQELCEFDYSESEGPNCDSGTIIGTEYTYTKTVETIDVGGVPTPSVSYDRTPMPIKHKCGGKAKNCLKGAGLAHIPDNGHILITRTEKAQLFEAEHSFASPFSERLLSNINIANYVRQCSGPVNNNDPMNFQPANSSDENRRNFDHLVLDRYINGRQYWTGGSGTTIFSAKAPFGPGNMLAPMAAGANIDTSDGWTKTYFAADSLMAIGIVKTAPYYAFYCLNSGKEIKARIKLAVRDWDRAFTANDGIDQLSDIYYRTIGTPWSSVNRYLGKMDTDSVELPEDDNPFNDFNDIKDWDDFLDTYRPMNHSCSAPANPVATPWFSSAGFIGGGL